MQRKTLTLLMITVILSTTIFSGISVKAKTNVTSKEKVISELGIMETDKGSTNDGTDDVSRAEFAQMLVNMSTLKDTVTAKSSVSLFSDVSKNHWASGYIKTAVDSGWMSGYINGSFKPTESITLQEAADGVVKLLGYTNSDFTTNRNAAVMNLYKTKGLNKNINKTATQYLTRNDCVNLFYNTLTTTDKNGNNYAQTLGYTLDSNGEVDYLSLVNSSLEGPILAEGNWQSEIPFSLTKATFYKNGTACSRLDIETYDVIYYSEKQSAIWAYDNKVTGTVSSIEPNRLSPSSITLAGKEYILGSTDMAMEFSSLGSVEEGDIVTICLGKDDTVVNVLSTDELNVTITGIVLDTSEHLVSNEKDDLYNTSYLTLVDAAGNEYEQDYDDTIVSFHEGDLAQISYTDGTADVKEYNTSAARLDNLTFSSDGSTLGTYKLAANAKILDYYDGKFTSVYASRLADVTLSGGSVYYYALNGSGEITGLILNNVSGDVYDYGIYLGIQNLSNSNMTSNYILDGKTSSATSDYFDAEQGPLGFIIDGTEITSIMKLNDITVKSIGETYVGDSTRKYQLSDDVVVYFYEDGEYLETTIDQISNLKKYSLTAYYDRTVSLGGRVRVIVAENNN